MKKLKNVVGHILLTASIMTVVLSSIAQAEVGLVATIGVSTEMNLSKGTTTPIELKVQFEDGKPYQGVVDLWASSGRIEDSKGVSLGRPAKLKINDGIATATLNINALPGVIPVELRVTIGGNFDQQLLGSATVVVRDPRNFSLIEDQTLFTVKANGQDQPHVAVLVKDQYDKTFPDCEVIFTCEETKTKISVNTNSDGIASVQLPPSQVPLMGKCTIDIYGRCFLNAEVLYKPDTATTP